jgi:hypothetical protein
MTVKTPLPPPLPDELERLLHRLRLPYVRRAAPEVIATATAQRWEHAEVLKVLLAEEAAGRDQATIRTRRRASGLPAGKTFDAWEPDRSVIPSATQQALRTLEWIDRAEVLCVCGPSGTGKSHFIEALGHQAIDKGRTVAWHTPETLAQLLRRHRVDDSVNKAIGTIRRLGRSFCGPHPRASSATRLPASPRRRYPESFVSGSGCAVSRAAVEMLAPGRSLSAPARGGVPSPTDASRCCRTPRAAAP